VNTSLPEELAASPLDSVILGSAKLNSALAGAADAGPDPDAAGDPDADAGPEADATAVAVPPNAHVSAAAAIAVRTNRFS